ncbi:hypothetical protein ES707_13093 [subsurface metagenome]
MVISRLSSGSPSSSRAMVPSSIVMVRSPSSEVASIVSCISPSSLILNAASSPNRSVSMSGARTIPPAPPDGI